MPAQLSKFWINTTCKEYSHPWTDSCISATAGLGLHTLQESLRIYSTFYLITLLMKGKVPSKEDVKKMILGIIQSTAFLSWSAFSYSMFICLLRRWLGNFHFLTVSFLPSFLSSLTAIIIERPSRHIMLCLYVSNIATETLFRMGVWRKYYPVIPQGQIYIFAASIAMLLYFFRSKEDKRDSIYKIIRFFIGKYEEKEYLCEGNAQLKNVPKSDDIKISKKRNIDSKKRGSQLPGFNVVWKALEVYKQIIQYLKNQSKHASCPHPYSCAHYIIMNSLKIFCYGFGGQIAIKLVLQMKRLLNRPKLVMRSILKQENMNLAVFLGGFTALYRLTSCLLRRSFNKDSNKYAIPAGIVASTAFMAYPDNTIALYVMWKALQILWNDAVESKKVPEVKYFTIFLYSFSTAVLFHAAIMEPQNLRSSYWKFLYTISGGRIATMRRIPLDEFGIGSYKHLQDVLKQTGTTDRITYSF